MDNSDAGTGYQYGINSHFNDGHVGTPYRVASSNGMAMADDPTMHSAFKPNSVLDVNTATPTANGMSKADYDSTVLTGGSRLPNANGQSPESFAAARYMNYIGEFAR